MKKLKNESGSALILALFLMILVSILIVSFSNQVANQIRSTINLDEDIQEMYSVESKIEKFIKYFIQGIDIVYKDDDTYEVTYKNLAYIKENEEEVSEYKTEHEKVIMKMIAEEIENTDSENNQLRDNTIKIPSNKNIVTFKLEITEVDNKNIKSYINVSLSKKVDENKNETWNVDYGVVSWRIRN